MSRVRNPEPPRGQCVAELVENDGGEHGQDEAQTVQRRAGSPVQEMGEPDPEQQQEEGGVNEDVDAEEPADLPGPASSRPLRSGGAGPRELARHLQSPPGAEASIGDAMREARRKSVSVTIPIRCPSLPTTGREPNPFSSSRSIAL